MSCRIRLIWFLVIAFLSFILPTDSKALSVPSRPYNFVTDIAGIIDSSYENRLNQYLKELEQKTTVQFAVLTIGSLEGAVIENFSLTVARKWGLGQKGKDNGALFLIAYMDRKWRVEVGYGLEDLLLPDGLLGSIVRKHLLPNSRKEQLSRGIFEAALAIANVIAKDAGVQLTGMPQKFESTVKQEDAEPSGTKAGYKEIHNKTHIVDLKTEGKLVKTEKIKTIAEIDYKEKKFRFSFFTKDFDKKDWNKEEKLIPLHIRHTNVAPQYMGILILHPKNVKILESKQKGFLVRDSMFSKKYGWEELLPYKDHRNAQLAMGVGEKAIDKLLSQIPFAKEGYKQLVEYCANQNKRYYDSIFKEKENYVATMIPLHIPKAIIGFTETARSIEIPFDLSAAQGEQKMSFWINPAFGNPSVSYSQGTWEQGFARLEGINIDLTLTCENYKLRPAEEKKDLKAKSGLNVSYMESYVFESVNLDSQVAIDNINEGLKQINNISYGLYSLKNDPNRFRLQVTGGIELSDLFRNNKNLRILEQLSARGKIGFLFENGGTFIHLRPSGLGPNPILNPDRLRNRLMLSEDSIIQLSPAENPSDIFLWISSSDLSASDIRNKLREAGIDHFIARRIELVNSRYNPVLPVRSVPAPQVRSGRMEDRKIIKRDRRFIAYDDGTVQDTKTNLMWAAKDNGSNINWSNAKSYCENYRGGGYTDWRMPTQDELAGLYDKSKTYQSDCGLTVHLTELIPITCPFTWASETRGSRVAMFFFGNGKRDWVSKSFPISYRALPVRGKGEAKIVKQPARMARTEIPARLWSKEDGIVHLYRRLELIKAVKWGRSWYPTFKSTPSSINPNSQEPQVVVFSEGRKVVKKRVLSSKNFMGRTKWYGGYTIEGSVYIAVNESFKELFPDLELRWSPLADPAEANNAVVSDIRLNYHHKKKFVYHPTNLPNIYADVIHFTKFSPMGHIHGLAPEIVLFDSHNRLKTRLEFKWRLKDDEKKKDIKSSVSEEKLKEASTGSDSKRNARQKLKDMGISFDLNTFLLYAGKGNTKVMDLFLSSGMHPDSENNLGRTALFPAVSGNRTDTVVFLLDRGANANHRDTRSATPLIEAVILGHRDIVTALLNKGADPNIRSPLWWAVASRHHKIEIVKALIYKGADVNVHYNYRDIGDGKTPLMSATPDVDSMKLLLKHGAKVNARDNRGKTALMYAASDVDSMKLLLKHGAKVNARDNRGKTALMYAASGADSVKLLLKNGAKVNARDNRGKTALMYAKYSVNSAKLLLRKGAIVSPSYDYLTDIVESKDKDTAEVVKILLDKGAKPTSAALLAAANNGNYDAVNSFLIRGVDVNQKDSYGRTALMIAAYMHHLDIVELLISKGANVNLLSPLHALHWALNYRGHLDRNKKPSKAVYEVVKVLIENGADINRRDPNGLTALSYVEGYAHYERIVKFMKKNGAVK